MYHILFIKQLLGCFHNLVFVTIAAVIMGLKTFCDPEFNSFGHTISSGISGLYGSSIFNSILLSKVTAPFHIPTNNTEQFQFFHNLTNTCYLLSLDNSHPKRFEVISHLLL